MRYYLERTDPEFAAKMAEVLCVYREVALLKQSAVAGEGEPPAGDCQIFFVSGLGEDWPLAEFGISRTRPSKTRRPTRAGRASPVKAVSRRRRWPKASLCRTCRSAKLAPRV